MRVVTAGGETIELGDVETTPTIGITDYSRRETDDFGVTTIVERGFARKMSVKLGVPFESVDALQRRLAALRATPALWVADDRFASLSVQGFYKEFDLDLAVPPLSYCTLTVEGLAEAAAPADAGGDPAPAGLPSTLQLLQPVIMTASVLAASNVAENDAAEWAGGASYQIGARVMKAATHRIYESLVGANAGNDPAGASGKWLDVGPTNRWAMFDQALGTSTSAAGAIVVTLDPGTAGAVALLDVVAGTVRVQANGYDRTLAAGAGAITFLDLPPAGQVTVTIAGAGTVSVGTLLIGRVVSLGITESSPTAGITDFSKKTIDDFGEVTIVQRAWTKKMAAKALIRTDAIDVVANRIAAVRARPSLWIGQAGLDSLTVYGFFKDFSIEVGETLSKLSLSIEGLSAAAKVAPLTVDVGWDDIKDDNPSKPKPQDGATVGAPSGTPVGNLPSDRVVDALAELAQTPDAEEIVAGAKALVDRARSIMVTHLSSQLLAEERKTRLDRLTHIDGAPISTRVRQEIRERVEGQTAIVEKIDVIEATAISDRAATQAAITEASQVSASLLSAATEQLTEAISIVTVAVGDERLAREAAITEVSTTSANALSAATHQLETAISTVQTIIDGEILDRQAAIIAERSTTADALSAATHELEAAISTVSTAVDGERLDREAAIVAERSTYADALSAATQSLETSISLVQTIVDGEISDRQAAITEERNTSASETGAVAESVTSLATTVGENSASITFLMESADGEHATVQITTEVNANGKRLITGFKINGEESLFTIAADRFIVGNSRIFEVDTVSGVVYINEAAIGTATIGTLNIKNGAFSGTVAVITGEIPMISTGEMSDPVSITTIGGTVRIDVQFESYRISGSGSANMTAQLFRQTSTGQVALTRAYKCPIAESSPPVSFFIADAPPAGPTTYFLSFNIGGSGGATYRVLPQTFLVTEFKR